MYNIIGQLDNKTMTAVYTPLDKSNRSEDMEFDYGVLRDKLLTMESQSILNEDGTEVGYYESKRNEIDFSWLNGESFTPEQSYIWHACMPLPIVSCRRLFEAAERGLPKKTVLSLVFPDYDLDPNEMQLFESVFNFAQAKGLFEVASELFEGARMGDPRAVKMYLEISGLLAVTAEDADETAKKKLMRISFNI